MRSTTQPIEIFNQGSVSPGARTSVELQKQLLTAGRRCLRAARVYDTIVLTNGDAVNPFIVSIAMAQQMMSLIEWNGPRTRQCGTNLYTGRDIAQLSAFLRWRPVPMFSIVSPSSPVPANPVEADSLDFQSGIVDNAAPLTLVLCWIVPWAAPIMGKEADRTALAVGDVPTNLFVTPISQALLDALFAGQVGYNAGDVTATHSIRVVCGMSPEKKKTHVGQPLICTREDGLTKTMDSFNGEGQTIAAWFEYATAQNIDTQKMSQNVNGQCQMGQVPLRDYWGYYANPDLPNAGLPSGLELPAHSGQTVSFSPFVLPQKGQTMDETPTGITAYQFVTAPGTYSRMRCYTPVNTANVGVDNNRRGREILVNEGKADAVIVRAVPDAAPNINANNAHKAAASAFTADDLKTAQDSLAKFTLISGVTNPADPNNIVNK